MSSLKTTNLNATMNIFTTSQNNQLMIDALEEAENLSVAIAADHGIDYGEFSGMVDQLADSPYEDLVLETAWEVEWRLWDAQMHSGFPMGA